MYEHVCVCVGGGLCLVDIRYYLHHQFRNPLEDPLQHSPHPPTTKHRIRNKRIQAISLLPGAVWVCDLSTLSYDGGGALATARSGRKCPCDQLGRWSHVLGFMHTCGKGGIVREST